MIKWAKGLSTLKTEVSFGSGVVLSLDPGSNGTGLAFWNVDAYNTEEYILPLACCNILPESGDKWLGVTAMMVREFESILEEFKIIRVDSEFPQYFDSAGGHSTAASGDLQKLSFIVGAYAACSWGAKIAYYPWMVNEWKGQMSKTITEKAIRRKLPLIDRLSPESHMWDAIGIGLHAQGKFVNHGNKSKLGY